MRTRKTDLEELLKQKDIEIEQLKDRLDSLSDKYFLNGENEFNKGYKKAITDVFKLIIKVKGENNEDNESLSF